jgi:signal transduction histidine kinase
MLRSRITSLVAAITSAVVLAFVIPLCLLVRTMAEDRAVTAARDQAQSVATIVASLPEEDRLVSALQLAGQDAPVRTAVFLPTGRVLGDQGIGSAGDAIITSARQTGSATTERDDDVADVVVPVAVDAGIAVVRSRVEFTVIRQGVATAWTAIIALGIALLGASVVIARQLSEHISTPVTALADVAHRLRGGELDARAQPAGPTEVVELGSALNLLAERIGELIAAEREAAADLSHRLRTPVTALRLDSDLIEDPGLADRFRRHVDDLHRAIDTVVSDARRSSREPMGGRCDARAVVAERVYHWTPLAEDQGRVVTSQLAVGAAYVPLSEGDVRDLVDNLLDNVFAHTQDGVPLRVVFSADSSTVRLVVEDGGDGTPASVAVERGESGSGSSGLGLDIVHRLARSAGGDVVLRESALGGLAVTVTLRRSA